jgi:hypothetical protein
MAVAASDDDQQKAKAKEDIRRYVHGRFQREGSVFRGFPIRT